MTTPSNTTTRRRPLTPQAFLDHEEARAIQGLAASVQRLGEDVCEATDLRARIRRHPFLAIGTAAVLGFFGGPLILRASAALLPVISGLRSRASTLAPNFPGLVMSSLRGLRANR